MQRPILISAIGFVLGIIWGLYFKNIILFFLFLLIYIIFYKYKEKLIIKRSYIVVFIISLLFSYYYFKFRDNLFEKRYTEFLNEKEIIGQIVSKPEQKEYTVKYILKKDGIKINLYIDRENNCKIQYGDIVKIDGDIKGLETARNYGGFDNKQYGKIKSIYGSIKASSIEVIGCKNSISKIFFKIKESIINKMEKILPNQTSGIALAILIGEKTTVSEESIQYFRDSSLIHMLCVSGAHVTYVSNGIKYLISIFTKKKKVIEVFNAIGLLFFICVIGFSVSAYRAFIMGILLILSKLFLRQSDIINNISLSLIILIIINPYNLLDVGLLLSFGGTFGIVFFSNIGKKYFKNKILQIMWVSISAQIIIMPITLYFFNTLNLTFFLSNLAVNSLFVFIIILGFLAVFVSYICMPIAKLIGVILNLLIILFQAIASVFANIPISNIKVITLPIIFILRLLYINIWIN